MSDHSPAQPAPQETRRTVTPILNDLQGSRLAAGRGRVGLVTPNRRARAEPSAREKVLDHMEKLASR